MSAETLRTAATLMRREREADPFYRAVADLLDDAAGNLDLNTPTGEAAVAVARTYLGSAA